MTRHFETRAMLLGLALACMTLLSVPARAQSPTGAISGRVTDTQGAGIPGVNVTVGSPALQGTQSAVTSAEGDYIFKLLPPGHYTITFRIQGFGEARHERAIAATEPVTLNVTLAPARLQETVSVVAETGAFVNTVEGATTVKQSLLDTLPTTRTLEAALALAPSAHPTGPGAAFSIAGSMSFENLFMVNGVPVQDNLRGEALPLYIEDAVQEVTVTSAGVSAQYGRFGGGVVNMVTKSGGNILSGSFRTTFNNDNWRSVSPFGESKSDRVVPTYEGTIGGPIKRDSLWFFGAVRAEDSTVTRETGFTRIPFERTTKETRFEAKATKSLGRGRRLAVNYVGIDFEAENSAWPSSSEVMDLASLTNPSQPQSLVGVHYTGAVGSRLFFEAQFSARRFRFERSGGLSTDLINGTPSRDQQTGAWWWAPNFCGVCRDEERNNDTLFVKGSYFLSTNSGAHDISFGYDGFNDKVLADNHQSGSDYHVWATASTIVDGVVYPVIEPGFSTYIIHWPLQANSQGTNFRTHSLFANDRWAVNRHLTFDLGLRYDKNSGRDAANALVANDSAVSPRLGLVWDPTGNGQTTVSLSAGRYVSSLNNSIAGAAAAAGNPSIIAYFYGGAPINTGDTLVPSNVALQQVFSWYNAENPPPFFVDIPGVATKIQGSLKSPYSDAYALGVSHQLNNRTSVRADLVTRKYGNFYGERIDTSTGLVFDDFGQAYDLKLIENTNDLSRRYRALNLQAGFRGTDLTLGAAYTLSRLWGNVDGENTTAGPIPSDLMMYPEYRERRWFAPEGDLSADQRHRLRAWAFYDLPFGRSFADVTVAALQSLQSGTPYGAVGGAIVSPFVSDPGYALPPDTQTYFYTARDAYRTAASYSTDLQVSLRRSLPGARRAELFAHISLLNAFNRFQAFRMTSGEINTTVITAIDDPNLELFNPFTETPVEGVHWRKGDDFGKPVARGAYTVPRTFSFDVGIRF